MRIEAQHQPILPVTEAALVLGCSVASVYRLPHEHRLRRRRFTPDSRRHLYDLSKVLRFKAAFSVERTRESGPCATVTVDPLETACGAALLLVRNR